MKRALEVSIALLTWGLTGPMAHAWYCYFPSCPPPCCVSYETRVVACQRPEWRAEKVPCVINQVSYRQEITKVKVSVAVPKMTDEKVRTSYYVPIPKVVERPVTTCAMVPIVMVDPCTGCCFVSCCPQWVTYNVKCTVYDYQLQTREDVVKVCRYVQEDRIVDQVRCVPEVRQVQSGTVRYTCVMVPYQTTVCVPVYSGCP